MQTLEEMSNESCLRLSKIGYADQCGEWFGKVHWDVRAHEGSYIYLQGV